DLVFIDEPQAGQATRVLAATRVKATVAKLRAVMIDPAAYRRAVPSFRRAEGVGRKGAEVQVAWELGVPRWNREGKLWLRPGKDVDPRRQPSAGPSPPALGALDGTALGRLARERLAAGQAAAAVRTRPDGRLDRVEVATPTGFGAEAVRRALTESQRWRALPG